MNQELFIGKSCISTINAFLLKSVKKKIFLVTGKKSFDELHLKYFLKSTNLFDFDVYRFFDFSPNPQILDVEKGVQKFKEFQCDLIVAIGGGSVIDMAKLINFRVSNGPLDSFLNKPYLGQSSNFLIAIPTTAGSGSESTNFAVVYKNKFKYSIEGVMPNIAIVDPLLLNNMPLDLKAISSIDAFCQAIESYWSVNSTDTSREYSLKALKLFVKHLKPFYFGDKGNHSYKIALASNLSGRAINIAKTTGPHAFSYRLTSLKNIPHGLSVALFMQYFFEINYKVQENDSNEARGVLFVKKSIEKMSTILNISKPEDFKIYFKNLLCSLNLPDSFHKLGVTYSEIEDIISQVDTNRLKNNPRKLIHLDLLDLIEKDYESI